MKLTSATALITGGAKRIGRSIALELAQRGTNLILHYNGSKKEAEETAEAAKSVGARVTLLQADFSLNLNFRKLVESIDSTLLPVNILINSASIFIADNPTHFNQDSVEKIFAINLVAPYLLSRTVIEHCMHKNKVKQLKIINLTDIIKYRATHLSYSISKQALAEMTQLLATEFENYDSTANEIAIGHILPPQKDGQLKTELSSDVQFKMRELNRVIVKILEDDSINGKRFSVAMPKQCGSKDSKSV